MICAWLLKLEVNLFMVFFFYLTHSHPYSIQNKLYLFITIFEYNMGCMYPASMRIIESLIFSLSIHSIHSIRG